MYQKATTWISEAKNKLKKSIQIQNTSFPRELA